MSSRDAILGRVRAAASQSGTDAERADAIATRLAKPPKGVIPARGQVPPEARIELFQANLTKLAATHERVASYDLVPKSVAAYLRSRNLPAGFRMGDDKRLTSVAWGKQKSLHIKRGPSDGDDEVGLSHASSGIAETGTLVMVSGSANPTTVNFLPEHHIVLVDAAQIDGDLETAVGRIRKKYGRGTMPRTVNLISGPSRSGDIEQKIILGAHGPKALHVIVVG